MKTLVPKQELVAVELEGEGLESLMGQPVLVMCMNYFYTGTLSGVNATCIKLTEPKIVYETGPWADKAYKDAQALPVTHIYIQIAAIESFGPSK